MVIGGLNGSMAAYSSAYLFDPGTEAWVKTGLMTTARAGAAATVLDDGRVLVVGGRYTSGYDYGATGGAALAAYTPAAGVAASAEDRPLATAELYDPRTGTWSQTGAMRYARHHPSVARLGGGRVLVWGGVDSGGTSASEPAEIYDPGQGRFRLAPTLPIPSAKSLIAVGVAPVHQDWAPDTAAGVLNPLANGDALMTAMTWSSDSIRIHQLVRFDAARGRWSFVGAPYVERLDPDSGSVTGHWGTQRPIGALAPLPDGQLLVMSGGSSSRVDGFDPVRNRWSRLPSLPTAVPQAIAVALPDGSILLGPSGGAYADAYRFVPES
ncbi:MAG: Kelch repeat-containing protein [Candidatus Limnocylindrales bacterium]